MKLKDKILAADNLLINWLTAVTWWIEVRFNKNNVDVAILCDRVSDLFEVVALIGFIVWLGDMPYSTPVKIASSLLLVINVTTFVRDLVFSQKHRQRLLLIYPQGFPNPCRCIPYHINHRLLVSVGILVCIMFGMMWLAHVDTMIWCLPLLMSSVIGFFYSYLLACDSLPPEEKALRRAKQEMKNLAIQSTGA